MPTTSNFGWTTPADTDLVKDGAAAIRTLGNGIDTSFLDLKGGTTGQVLSKATNTDLDYTWITPNVGDLTEVQAGTGISVASGTGPIPVVTNTVATTFDAKGDLVAGTGADTFAKLTVGANDTVLTADSTTATGLKWATPASGGMTLLASGSFSGSSVTVSSISGAYNNLYVVVRNYKPATNDIYARIRLNGDTGTNYFLAADHGTYRNSQAFDATFLYMGGQNSSSASEALCIMTFWDYANTTTWKMQTGQAIMTDAANTANMEVFPMFGAWKNTGAINSINFAPTSGNFTSGDYYIYGVK